MNLEFFAIDSQVCDVALGPLLKSLSMIWIIILNIFSSVHLALSVFICWTNKLKISLELKKKKKSRQQRYPFNVSVTIINCCKRLVIFELESIQKFQRGIGVGFGMPSSYTYCWLHSLDCFFSLLMLNVFSFFNLCSLTLSLLCRVLLLTIRGP